MTQVQSSQLEEVSEISPQNETEALHPHHILAKVNGVDFTELPEDLYIPPDALEVFLEAFEGPLDLLLYLIRKHNLDILNIPIAEITRQYMEYVELMKELRLELAADYLVMAAMLAEIKSRMLLPRSQDAAEIEEDPRAELVRRLQEYERFKQAAEKMELMPRMGRDVFTNAISVPEVVQPPLKPQVELSELLGAFLDILKRSELLATHKVQREPLSVRERMSHVLELVNQNRFIVFQACFNLEEGRLGVVVSFLAILELLRLGLIDIVQTEPYGQIHLKVIQHDEADEISISQAQASDEREDFEKDKATQTQIDGTSEPEQAFEISRDSSDEYEGKAIEESESELTSVEASEQAQREQSEQFEGTQQSEQIEGIDQAEQAEVPGQAKQTTDVGQAEQVKEINQAEAEGTRPQDQAERIGQPEQTEAFEGA